MPEDSKGCRYFSTAKLLKVLIGCIKHAINDVIPDDEENNDKDKSVTCKQKNNMAVLDVKVYFRYSIMTTTFNTKLCIHLSTIICTIKSIPV